MVQMRDGIRLATDLYRPARDGELVPGRYPTIVCMTPYDKTERRYVEIADFFVPHGYAVVLQDLRDRHRSEGTQAVLPQRHAAHRRGRLRHDRVDRRAAVEQRPHGDGRQLLRRDHADPHRAREPAAPDRDLAGRHPDEHLPEPDARGRRDAAAHVLGALHPRRRPPGREGGLGEAARGLRRPAAAARAPLELAPAARRPRAPPRAGARPDARGLLHARRLRRVLGREGERLHALLARARRHPRDDDDRLVRPLPARRQRVLGGDDGEERVAAAADHRAVEPRRHAGRRDVDARRRLRADVGLGRAALLRRAARRSSTAGCPTTRAGSRRTRRP